MGQVFRSSSTSFKSALVCTSQLFCHHRLPFFLVFRYLFSVTLSSLPSFCTVIFPTRPIYRYFRIYSSHSFLSFSLLFFSFIFPLNFYFDCFPENVHSFGACFRYPWLECDSDMILTSDDEFGILHAPLSDELSSSVLNVRPVELRHYCYEEVLLIVERMVDPTFRLRDIQSNHVRSLATSMRAL